MLTRTFNDLPFEYLAPGKFEELCLALVRRAVDPNAQHLGAAGADEGYDVRAAVDGKLVCYQCKRYQTFQLSHAKKAIKDAFDGKEPPDEMVFVLPRTVRVELRRQIKEACSVPCSFWARTELQDRIWPHEDLVERFFGNVRSRTPAPHWTIPRRNPYFTGRAEVIQSLHDALLADGKATLGQTRAVVGLGGVGKTQTAIEYANAFHLNYSAAFWIAAETESSLRASLTEMARILELPEADAAEEDVVVQAVLHRLASDEGWLLVYDNVEDPELLDRFQPPKLTGHVLMTSRDQSLAQHQYRLLELATFSEDEALAFLLDRTQRELEADSEEYQAAEKLVEVLGRLPLALEQAAAYILSLKTSFSKYLDAYRSEGVTLLDAVQAKGHPESVTKTWAMNLRQVEQENPLSVRLFHILAFLAPDDVPEFLFRDGEGLDSDLADELASSSLALDRLLEPLQRFSLIERDRAAESISMHRLMQEMTQLAMSDDVQRAVLQQVGACLDHHFPASDSLESWPRCERLLVQVLNFGVFEHGHLLNNLAAARGLERAANYCLRRALYLEAEPLYTRSLRITEAALGNDHPDVAQTLNNLAILYKAQGRYEQAEPLYTRSLRIREAALGNDHPSVAQTLNNLALLYSDQGRYEQAEPLYTRSLRIREAALGNDHPDVASTLNNLANLYSDQGRYEQAEPLYTRSLRIKEAALGNDHPDVATTLNNLANLYKAQGRYEQAEPLYARSLRIKEAALGNDHPSVATSVHCLANLYRTQDRNEEADTAYSRARGIYETTLGDSHPELAMLLTNQAVFYRNLERHEEAGSLCSRAVNMYWNRLGVQHPHTSWAVDTYEDILKKLNRHDEADQLRADFDRALAEAEATDDS